MASGHLEGEGMCRFAGRWGRDANTEMDSSRETRTADILRD